MNDGSTDTQLQGKFTLGRKLLPNGKFSRKDKLLETFDEYVLEAFSTDGFEKFLHAPLLIGRWYDQLPL
jgi:hypothetical protein